MINYSKFVGEAKILKISNVVRHLMVKCLFFFRLKYCRNYKLDLPLSSCRIVKLFNSLFN